MTAAYAQEPIDFDAIDANTRAKVTLVSTDWRSDEDYAKFVTAIRASVGELGYISQNDVRLLLLEDTVKGPRCSIEHHRFSAFYSRACKDGLIVKARYLDGDLIPDICTTSPTGNNGKFQTLYRWTG